MFGYTNKLLLSTKISSCIGKHFFSPTVGAEVSKTCIRGLKMTVLGASSRMGEMLSFLMKGSGRFQDVVLHDNDISVKGLALALNSINVGNEVSYSIGEKSLKTALKDSKCVILAGGHRFYGNTADMPLEEFHDNCRFVYESAKACSSLCPMACVCVLTSPQNSTVPIACEVLKNCSHVSRKVIGINTYQAIRASQLLGEHLHLNSSTMAVPVIGGCSPKSCVPLISFSEPCISVPFKSSILLTRKFQGQTTNSQNNRSDTTSLSSATAAFRFLDSLRKALEGEKNIIEHGFVKSDEILRHPYCGMPIILGQFGVECIPGIPGDLTSYELSLLVTALNLVEEETAVGLDVYKEMAQMDEPSRKECQIS